jgi:chemotaxis protein methyltransferase CheR
MPDDGFLVLGAAETVIGLTDAFKPLADKRGLYVPNGAVRQSQAAADNVIRFATAKGAAANIPRL